MTILYGYGGAVKGDLIYARARNISKPTVIVQTGRHKAQRVILKDNAFCVIEKKLKYLGE